MSASFVFFVCIFIIVACNDNTCETKLKAQAFSLTAASQKDHQIGDEINIKVNALRSAVTQTPYDYYYAGYPRPHVIVSDAENLGQILLGEKSENSLYKVRMLENQTCVLTEDSPKSLTDKEISLFNYLIDNDYVNNWSCEDLPSSSKTFSTKFAESLSSLGFVVGTTNASNAHLLYNHLDIVMSYNQPNADENLYRIVGFEVYPSSLLHLKPLLQEQPPKCSAIMPVILEELREPIYFTYSVTWLPSNKRWVTRWNLYSELDDPRIHWFSVINALVIVLFLGGMVAMVLLRTLLKDIARYNASFTMEEASQEDWGWKLSHGDVFRKPNHFSLLAACAGTGVQILGIMLALIVFVVLGLLSPNIHGQLLQALLLLFGSMGFPAGYVTAFFNKIFRKDPFHVIFPPLLTALLFPGVCFAVFSVLNVYLWHRHSTGAIPAGSFIMLLILWLAISCPLVFIGYKVGYARDPIRLPVSTNKIPREIPAQNWITHPIICCLIGGLLPFGAIFTELLFLLSSFWLRRFYVFFGFLLLVLLILVVACAEISITLTYFRLVSEDYLWWWKSFFYSASSGVYVFVYTIFYFFTNLNIQGFVPVSLYFGYMFLFSYAFSLLTGACGFIATFFFIKTIYASVKIE